MTQAAAISRSSPAGAGGSAAVLERYDQAVMNTFGTPKRVFVRGEGCYVWDADGRRHLDLLVRARGQRARPRPPDGAVGHHRADRHPRARVELLRHARPGRAGRPAGRRWSAPPGEARVFFTNSGTEANEAAFKITRATGRTKIISTEGAFHGRSMGALAITHNPKYREPFEPLPGRRGSSSRTGTPPRSRPRWTTTVAAVVLEPIQGENGIVVPPADYLARARADVRRSTAPCSGSTRCRPAWAGPAAGWCTSTEGVRADVVTLAKGLGNGFPIGACLATRPRPRSCSARAATAAPSAATRWRPSPVWRSSR